MMEKIAKLLLLLQSIFLMECSWNAAGTQLSAFISQICTKITTTAWSYDNYLWIRALGLRHYTQLEISQEPEDDNKHKAEKLGVLDIFLFNIC